jgi:hypothetical protein
MYRISRFPEYHAAMLSHEKKKKLAKAAAAVSVVADKSKDPKFRGAKNNNVTKD